MVAGLAGLAVTAQLWGLYRVVGPPDSPWFPHADKMQHAAGFAAPVALLLLALGLRAIDLSQRLTRRALVVVAVFAAHAVVSEVVQHQLYARRTGDVLDVLADLVGVGLGAALALGALRRWTASAEPSSRAAEPRRVVAS